MISVFIPGLVTKTPNGADGRWVRTFSRRKLERGTAALMLRQSREKAPDYPLTITLTRCAPRTLDDDNAVYSMKSVRDGVADFLKINDRDPRVTWKVEQRKATRLESGTLVEIRGRVAG